MAADRGGDGLGLSADRLALGFIGLGATSLVGAAAGAAYGPLGGLVCGGLTSLLSWLMWDNAAWVTAAAAAPPLQLRDPNSAALRALRSRAVQVVIDGVGQVAADVAAGEFALDGFPAGRTARPAFPVAPAVPRWNGSSTDGSASALQVFPSWDDLADSDVGRDRAPVLIHRAGA